MARPKKAVLLVESRDEVMYIRRFVLQTRYQVMSATSANDAISILNQAAPDEIDVMISDFHIPGINGNELCRIAKEIRPEIRCLVVSETLEHFEQQFFADIFLPKDVSNQGEIFYYLKKLSARKRGPKPNHLAKYRLEHKGKYVLGEMAA